MAAYRFAFVFASLITSGAAQADVYKCVDAAGHLTYTNDKPAPGQKGCTLLSRDIPRANASPGAGTGTGTGKRAANNPSPAGFPRVDSNTQRTRDSERKRILEQELAAEEKLLAESRSGLEQAERDRQSERDFQKYLDRVNGLRDTVRLHETNIGKLKSELANTR